MKKNIFLLIAILGWLTVSAQATHEFSIQGGGGFSTLIYKSSVGKLSGGYGGEFGLGYSCMFNQQWGVYAGLAPAFYNTILKLDGGTIITENLKDMEGDIFDMYTNFNKFKEIQSASYLNIPVMAQFQTKTPHVFFANAGIKIGFPLGGKSKTKDGSLSNAGFYHETENWAESQIFAGFGSFSKRESNEKLSLKTTVMLALEAGMKWDIRNKMAFYLGAYFDYGLTNINKTAAQPFVNYFPHKASEFTTNSVLPLVANKVNLIAIGIKLKLGFALKKKDNL